MSDNAAIEWLKRRIQGYDDQRNEIQSELDAARIRVTHLEDETHKRSRDEIDFRNALAVLEVHDSFPEPTPAPDEIDIYTSEPTA